MGIVNQQISWLSVVGGIIVSLLAGCIVGIFAGFAGLSLHPRFGWVVGPLGVAAIIAILILISRRHSAGFARGIIIGGCIAVMLCGTCAYVFKGL